MFYLFRPDVAAYAESIWSDGQVDAIVCCEGPEELVLPLTEAKNTILHLVEKLEQLKQQLKEHREKI